MSKSESYIKFIELNPKPKTKVFAVIKDVMNLSNTQFVLGYTLGLIKWYGPWRQYCFFPKKETIFSKGCMDEIIEYINELMKERKT